MTNTQPHTFKPGDIVRRINDNTALIGMYAGNVYRVAPSYPDDPGTAVRLVGSSGTWTAANFELVTQAPKTYTLILSEAEARTLQVVLSRVGGSSTESPRKHVARIVAELQGRVGVPWHEHPENDLATHDTISFNSYPEPEPDKSKWVSPEALPTGTRVIVRDCPGVDSAEGKTATVVLNDLRPAYSKRVRLDSPVQSNNGFEGYVWIADQVEVIEEQPPAPKFRKDREGDVWQKVGPKTWTMLAYGTGPVRNVPRRDLERLFGPTHPCDKNGNRL